MATHILTALLQGSAPVSLRFSCHLPYLQAVTRNELYGFLHPSTREWKEGLMSVIYRDMSNNKTNKHQWIVLDGDIDAEWIESMNTVMDDNKMLTLASNERIPLSASMRLLLEINHMNHCSPATVSRGGVIYVNADDVGWKPVSLSGVKLAYSGTLQLHECLPAVCVLLFCICSCCMGQCWAAFAHVLLKCRLVWVARSLACLKLCLLLA